MSSDLFGGSYKEGFYCIFDFPNSTRMILSDTRLMKSRLFSEGQVMSGA